MTCYMGEGGVNILFTLQLPISNGLRVKVFEDFEEKDVLILIPDF